MSQGLHQGIFDFSDGFDRPRPTQTDHHQSDNTTTVYDPTTGGGNMLSDMFDFHHSGMSSSSATQLLTNQISSGYYARLQQRPPMNSWNPNTVGALMNPHPHHHQQQPTICISSAADETQIPQALPLYHHHEFINSHTPNLQGQGGLSLSLSSSMQQPFEISKEETPASSLYYNNINIPLQQGQVGFNGQLEVMNILRHSKYAKATRELLEEFCSVNRDDHDHAVKNRKGKRLRLDLSSNPNQPTDHRPSSSSSKQPSEPNLSSSQRFEQQRRKSGLLSMLDEIDRRYSYYCEKMQMIVNSFDAVMDLGAAKPYTGLAQKAMSRHFRCLKDGVIAQLKHTCELLGDKDTAITSGITKGETPRLKILDRNLRQQRSFNHMGMTEQETWRPQRGLPERSVNILRAWLFEHFLHPYPSDGDKHLLARQTGLTRNQVSNWFINARVRLWKPMVEEMYLEESKQEEDKEAQGETCCSSAAGNKNHSHHNQLKSLPNEFPFGANNSSTTIGAAELQPPMILNYESEMNIGVPTQIRFGDPGDVSLTLGLQQSVNMSAENNSHRFSLREFND